MNKQEKDLIQFIVEQTQIDRDTVIRILNHRGVTELSEKYEKALKDAEELNVDPRIGLEATRSMLKTDIVLEGRKSKLNKELLKESPEIVIQVCRAYKEFYFGSLLGLL